MPIPALIVSTLPSATSSDPERIGRATRRVRHSAWLVALAWAVLAAVLGPTAANAKIFLTTEEALELAFPGCEVERQTIFLTEAQIERASQLADDEIDSALVHPYVAHCEGEVAGAAYFDTHRVRTLAETLMVVVDHQGRLMRTEILAFREPQEYIPKDIWYEQFEGQALDEELDLKREIRGVTGATLTARATTDAVRRVLAIHQILADDQEKGTAE